MPQRSEDASEDDGPLNKGRSSVGSDPVSLSPNPASSSSSGEQRNILPQQSPIPSNKPIVEPPLLSDTLMWRYIGVLTRAQAEDAVKPPTEFRFYHQWEPMEKTNEVNRLPLTIIYRSSRNNPFHWLVRTMGEIVDDNVSKQREFLIRGYYIEHGGPMFPNLSTLVQFYENHSYNRSGYIDAFSVPIR